LFGGMCVVAIGWKLTSTSIWVVRVRLCMLPVL
jgi:hypothetical protein